MAQGESPTPSHEPDLVEVLLDVDGAVWRVEVLGRSGGPSGRPPLLLLGFWHGEERNGPPACESTVVGRTLAGLSPETLERALADASQPRKPARRNVFFEDASQGRRK